MAKTPLIDEWAEASFGGFYVDRYWQDGRWVLERGPIRLAGYHKRILRHVFTPGDDGKLPYDVVAWCEPAKSGKSAVAGLCAEYAALHLDGDVIMASNKRAQAASLMYRSLTDSIEWNPHLRTEPNKYEVEFKNGNVARAIPSSYRGEAGARFSLVVFDELWGYIYQDAQRLWGEFKTDPTRRASLKMAVGYAGYLESDLWKEQLDKGLAGEPVPELLDIEDGRGGPACWRAGRHFTFWSHECKQPWQTAEWIRSQRQSLRPNQFARMIRTDFAAGEGDFIDPELWTALVDPTLTPLEPGRREPVYLGLDLAVKPGGDDAAVVALYETRGGKIGVAFHQLWKGGRHRTKDLRISQTVKPYILDVARAYNVQVIGCDPWQSYQLIEDLRRAGIPTAEVPQTHQRRGPADTVLYELARNGDLVLYDHPDLAGAAASASAKELGNGLLFITKTGRGKVDTLVAMSNALVALATPVVVEEIVYNPVAIGPQSAADLLPYIR
jgi:hypothetical protein